MPHITLSAFLKESWPWLLAFLLFLMGLVAAWQWFRKQLRDNADDTAFDSEMLTQCREMLEEGELSAEEFRLIKGRLGQSGLAPSARAPKEQTDKPA